MKIVSTAQSEQPPDGPQMIPDLPLPDHRHLEGAVAWLVLDDYLEADKELDQITPAHRSHPDVLGIRWQVCARAGKWNACVALARAVIKMQPGRLAAWMDLASALRQATGLQAAYDSLLPAFDHFPAAPFVPYQMARYACQLGRITDARDFLDRAFSLAAKIRGKRRLKLMALDEPDLEPLWARIGEAGK